MAIQKQVAMLRQGTARWNSWRQKHPDETIDLRDAHFSGADLRGANLRDAHLSGADLGGADLGGAHLSGAHLRDADLHLAHLRDADLFEADLRDADLRDADLGGADLFEADLGGADLGGANLGGADLIKADLRDANLSRANLSRATVRQTIFGSLDLRMVEGLETIHHQGPSEISTSTLEKSNGEIPDIFLKGAGVSDTLIASTHALFHQPIEYYTCFISYASQDEVFARRLHNDLQQEGVRCWFAPEDMNIGGTIRHRIDESIRLYDKVLLILSAPALTGNWVAYEVERALNKEPQGTHHVLYPVRIDQTILTCTEPWALEIKSTRHIGNFEDWTDPQQYQENFKRLLRALNTKKDPQKN